MTEGSETLKQLLDQAKQQQMFLEMFVRSWGDDYRLGGGTIHCGKGCSNCCRLAVHTGFAEALAIARQMGAEQAREVEAYALKLREMVQGVAELPHYLRLHRDNMGFCPLLNDDGACGVYPVRPLTCRSLISTRESAWCGADFSKIAPADRDAFLAGLDRKVVSFPSHYVAALQESGKELEEAGAQLMRSLLGFALYGNLGVLVHLCHNHDLAGAALQGRDGAVSAIREAGFDHPLLVNVS
ncbi:YkgJ family cysteine cluster protein [Geomonas subterranea]|uniref:YkgJ family cysteine cluster protein n=1 Tax=Geomonas subterranea TaxID=2847989 RepID=A0ABX8LL47_9BACT|nr:YkgJ family cysteine cluster protein [Geomonas subterranea]QXE92765.1 YkgJ family cysteine cluster protein [Geomonas subterranea]QXM09131.1 YkgJ family cysteine cluster protein [Geomonas subterranea]